MYLENKILWWDKCLDKFLIYYQFIKCTLETTLTIKPHISTSNNITQTIFVIFNSEKREEKIPFTIYHKTILWATHGYTCKAINSSRSILKTNGYGLHEAFGDFVDRKYCRGKVIVKVLLAPNGTFLYVSPQIYTSGRSRIVKFPYLNNTFSSLTIIFYRILLLWNRNRRWALFEKYEAMRV